MGKSFLEQARDEGRVEGRTEGERIGINKGERIGIDKGRTEGRVEERTEVAQRLLAKHFGDDVVGEVTGLSASEIETMRNSLNGS